MKYSFNIGSKLDSSDEQFIVISNNTVFLRLALNKKNNLYDLMTATANDGGFLALSSLERKNVIQASQNYLTKAKIEPNIQYDHKNREYIYLSRDIKDEEELQQIVTSFFNEYNLISTGANIQKLELEKSAEKEMQDLYRALSTIDGHATYLYDGMWLHPDGKIKSFP